VLGCGVEGNFEVVEESVHPEEASNRQIFRKAGSNVDDSARRKEHDVVKIVARGSIDAEGFFDRPFFDFQPYEPSNAGMKIQREAPESITVSNRLVRGAFLEGSAMLTFNIVL
jgi:hypothetical protein